MDVQSRRDGCGLYAFAQFTLDVPERGLTCGAQRIHLAPKTFEVLVALVTRPHRLVTKREILARVWPDVFVEEGIPHGPRGGPPSSAGRHAAIPAYIETVSRSGYRFVAEVRSLTAAEAATGGTHDMRAHA